MDKQTKSRVITILLIIAVIMLFVLFILRFKDD
jgi:hypothetical protein